MSSETEECSWCGSQNGVMVKLVEFHKPEWDSQQKSERVVCKKCFKEWFIE